MSFIKVTDPRKREELIKDFIETRKRIKDNFIARKVGEAEYQTGLTKLFKPVTETQKATAKEITDAQKEATERIEKGLLPLKEGIEGLTMLPIETGEPITAIKYTEKEKTELGALAVDSLNDLYKEITEKKRTPAYSDILPADAKKGLYKIGRTNFKINENDLYFDFDKIDGTPGLWKLLTSRGIPDKKDYKPADLYNYTLIMYNTNATRQDYNKDNRRISGNNKMNNLIKPFVLAFENDKIEEKIKEHFKDETEDEDEDEEEGNAYKLFDTDGEGIKGKGLKFLPSDPNALIDRFDLLFSSKKAGHSGVRNEIISILDELKRQGVIKTNEYKKLNSIIKK